MKEKWKFHCQPRKKALCMFDIGNCLQTRQSEYWNLTLLAALSGIVMMWCSGIHWTYINKHDICIAICHYSHIHSLRDCIVIFLIIYILYKQGYQCATMPLLWQNLVTTYLLYDELCRHWFLFFSPNVSHSLFHCPNSVCHPLSWFVWPTLLSNRCHQAECMHKCKQMDEHSTPPTFTSLFVLFV